MKSNPSRPASPGSILQSIRSRELLASPLVAGLALLLVCLLSYALVINRLGFYWDSWPMTWIAQTRGAAGLAQYFSTNRPVWGLLYRLNLPALGTSPLVWQIFGLGWRWLAAMVFWRLLRLLWPRQVEAALGAALFFAVYPPFQQQSIGLLYGHFWIVITAYLGALACSLQAIRAPKTRFLWLGAGLLLSAANLLMMEYFFLLELLRPVLLWLTLAADENGKTRLRKTIAAWAPYLLVFVGAVFWRVILFPYTTYNYPLETLTEFKTQPLQTIWQVVQRFFGDIWVSVGQAWIHAIQAPSLDPFGEINLIRYILIVIGVAVVSFGLFWLVSTRQPTRPERLRFAGSALLVSALGLALAGWPFLLTNMPPTLAFAFDRFTLPFIFGACLLWTGLIWLLPWRPLRWIILAGLVGLGVGFQYHTGLSFRQDWVNQQEFFWQLHWRVPALAPDTVIFANENRVTAYSTDNSLTAPLNWIYDAEKPSTHIRYLMIYPTIRLNPNNPLKLVKDWPVGENLLVGEFAGNTSRSITVFYNGSTCLRMVDPLLDGGNPLIPDDLKQTAGFADLSLIQDTSSKATPLPKIFGNPPENSWCQVYEQADLLRQSGQWYNIIELWKTGKSISARSNFTAELAPFVEAFARTSQWEEAARLTIANQRSRPVFCPLWQNLDRTTPAGTGKAAAVRSAMDQLECSEYGIYPGQP